MKYELEKVIVIGHEDDHRRREESIAHSDSFNELIEKAKTIPLKGSRYRHEWLVILEKDEHGDIIDHARTIFADDEMRKR